MVEIIEKIFSNLGVLIERLIDNANEKFEEAKPGIEDALKNLNSKLEELVKDKSDKHN